jgi:hypothetical protein
MRRLGVARALLPRQFRGPAVASTLRALLDSPAVAASCRAVAARFADDPRPMDAACGAIEALVASAPIPA